VVDDLVGAIATARPLAGTLDMPRRPDSTTITEANGKIHYCGIAGSEAVNEGRQSP
jgi:hypothetical protein